MKGILPVACGDFGSDWPLTLEYGFLRCEVGPLDVKNAKRVVFTTPAGRDYAVNEAARWGGYARIAPIFKAGAGPRYQSALVPRGEELCPST